MIQSQTSSKISKYTQKQFNSIITDSVIDSFQADFMFLRKNFKKIVQTFLHFKAQILIQIQSWALKLKDYMNDEFQKRKYLQNQLEKSKNIQSNMKNQVIQLKKMINQAISDYTLQIEKKQQTINELTIKLQQKEKEKKQQEISQLTIIQQQSQNTTISQVSGRQTKQISESRIIPQTLQRQIQFQLFKYSNEPKQQKKAKCFIDNFRKTIEQSCKNQPNKQQQKIKIKNKEYKQNNNTFALKQITNISLNTRNNKKIKQQFSNIFDQDQKSYKKTINNIVLHSKPSSNIMQNQQKLSNSSSTSQLITCSETQNINTIKIFDPPFSLKFFKKKDNRILTEPSPQKLNTQYTNLNTSNIRTSPRHKIFGGRKQSSQKYSHQRSTSKQEKRSMKSSTSKQKIKVTSKFIEQSQFFKKNNNSKTITQNKNLVYLGGKSLFRKFLIQLKQSIKKYVIFAGNKSQQLRYEGQRKCGQRTGKGKLYYKNGLVYQGQFKCDLRHGKGCLSINGVSIYQGEWCQDKINGEGYLKSLKIMSQNCPLMLSQASYCGNFKQGFLHGIGTLFLNTKQKIVTKFQNGIPIGQLTYYNINDIDFAAWPTD